MPSVDFAFSLYIYLYLALLKQFLHNACQLIIAETALTKSDYIVQEILKINFILNTKMSGKITLQVLNKA